MSLQVLPTELFLLIASYLPKPDQQCLRITCRGFLSLLPPPRIPRWDQLSDYFSNDIEDRMEFVTRKDIRDRLTFVERLFLPGNVLSDMHLSVCIKCVRILP